MKKLPFNILLAITIAFLFLLVGFYLGRQSQGPQIQVSNYTPATPTQVTTAPTEAATEAISFPISLNTATKEELIALPGIGEALSARIIAFREQYGPFESLEELTLVSGIGDKLLAKIRDYLVLE